MLGLVVGVFVTTLADAVFVELVRGLFQLHIFVAVGAGVPVVGAVRCPLGAGNVLVLGLVVGVFVTTLADAVFVELVRGLFQLHIFVAVGAGVPVVGAVRCPLGAGSVLVVRSRGRGAGTDVKVLFIHGIGLAFQLDGGGSGGTVAGGNYVSVTAAAAGSKGNGAANIAVCADDRERIGSDICFFRAANQIKLRTALDRDILCRMNQNAARDRRTVNRTANILNQDITAAGDFGAPIRSAVLADSNARTSTSQNDIAACIHNQTRLCQHTRSHCNIASAGNGILNRDPLGHFKVMNVFYNQIAMDNDCQLDVCTVFAAVYAADGNNICSIAGRTIGANFVTGKSVSTIVISNIDGLAAQRDAGCFGIDLLGLRCTAVHRSQGNFKLCHGHHLFRGAYVQVFAADIGVVIQIGKAHIGLRGVALVQIDVVVSAFFSSKLCVAYGTAAGVFHGQHLGLGLNAALIVVTGNRRRSVTSQNDLLTHDMSRTAYKIRHGLCTTVHSHNAVLAHQVAAPCVLGAVCTQNRAVDGDIAAAVCAGITTDVTIDGDAACSISINTIIEFTDRKVIVNCSAAAAVGDFHAARALLNV